MERILEVQPGNSVELLLAQQMPDKKFNVLIIGDETRLAKNILPS